MSQDQKPFLDTGGEEAARSIKESAGSSQFFARLISGHPDNINETRSRMFSGQPNIIVDSSIDNQQLQIRNFNVINTMFSESTIFTVRDINENKEV
jgi:hypothetical protein